MKTNISSILSQVRENTTSVLGPVTELKPLGDPNCPHCAGVGYARFDVPFGHGSLNLKMYDLSIMGGLDLFCFARYRLCYPVIGRRRKQAVS